MKSYRIASPEAMRLDVPGEPDPALIDPPPRTPKPEPEPDIDEDEYTED